MKSIDSQLGFGCGHQFCYDCVKNGLELSIKDRTVGQKCPSYGCKELADENVIKLIVSKQMFNKYKENSRRRRMRERNIKVNFHEKNMMFLKMIFLVPRRR